MRDQPQITHFADDRTLARLQKMEAALRRIAITDDADCVIANDPKAMTKIAREALK